MSLFLEPGLAGGAFRGCSLLAGAVLAPLECSITYTLTSVPELGRFPYAALSATIFNLTCLPLPTRQLTSPAAPATRARPISSQLHRHRLADFS